MSQSATLYRVTETVFQSIPKDTQDFLPYEHSLDSETFDQTHEGLLFVLCKGLPQPQAKLAQSIFNASDWLGGPDTLDFETNYANNLDLEDFESMVPYTKPANVREIHALLEPLNEDFFRAHFDSEEMNRKGIYPWAWGSGGFSYESTWQDFVRLKAIFARAAHEDNYLLVYIG